MKKKVLALLLALAMVLAVAACGGKDDGGNKDAPSSGGSSDTQQPAAAKKVKVGLICIGDENDQGYTYNFIRGKDAATEALKAKGIDVEWVVKWNIGGVPAGFRPAGPQHRAGGRGLPADYQQLLRL